MYTVRPTKAFGYNDTIRITFADAKAMEYIVKAIEEIRHLFI